jgi:hypothetical protein
MRRSHSLIVAAALSVAFSSAALSQVSIDGTLDASGYTRFATQTVETGFGDNQSELNAGYFNISGGVLNLMITGNLESNNNKLVLFFDTRAGGQNVMRGDNPDVNFNNLNSKYEGMKFDLDFEPDYFLSFSRDGQGGNPGDGNIYVDFSELNTNGGGLGGFIGSVAIPGNGSPQIGSGTVSAPGFPTLTIGYNDSNIAGVGGGNGPAADPAAAEAVTTGFEFAIDLVGLGIAGDFKLMVGINGSSHDYWSNQFLAGLEAPQSNLGGDGAGNFTGDVKLIDFSVLPGTQFVTIPYAAPSSAWNVDAGGNWSNAANWLGGVPNGATAVANLGSAITSPQTIELSEDVTVSQLNIGSANTYTIAGTNSLTIAGNPATPAVTVVQGDHTITAPVIVANTTRFDIGDGSSLDIRGSLDATGRDLFKLGAGDLHIPATNSNSLTVNAGVLVVAGAPAESADNSLVRGVTVDQGARLDITNTVLLVDYDEGFSPVEQLLDYAGDGRLIGVSPAIGWLDSGLASLTSFNGTEIDSTTLVFRSTLAGDTNLDLAVNFTDLLALAQNYDPNGTGKIWAQGDFDRDGTVGFTDLLSLAQNYSGSSITAAQGFSPDFVADWSHALSVVPEPATLGLLAGMGILALRRRA